MRSLLSPLPALPLLGARSWHSLMDGARSPADLAEAAAGRGWNALALADTNNLYALPELADAAAAVGIKAIASASIETAGISLRAYCLNRKGFSRLCGILSRVLAVEVPRRRLRLPRELLLEEAADYDETDNLLLAERSAEEAGREGRFPLHGRGARRRDPGPRGRNEARVTYDPLADLAEGGWEGLALSASSAEVLRRLAGRGLLYAGLPLGLPQVATSRLARELSLPILAEHSARFVEAADAELWRLARAIEERRSLAAIEREGREEPQGSLLVARGRAAEFLSAFPEAQANAASLAEEAEAAASFFASPPVFPAYQGMSDEESFRLLRSLCESGVGRRYGPGPERREDLGPRLERELRIIRDKGFSAYFLVVRDIVLRCPRTCGRGSAASSLVSYLLGLTHVDPLEHDLFFERFLNEGRTDPPDIDIDFPWDERPGVLASVFRDYEGRAAMVADHCGFSDAGAIRESALALGMNEKELKAARLAYRIGRADELPEELRRLARMVRGMPRYIGMHPGGIVVTPGPITDYTHVQPSPAGLPVLAWEKDGTERAGLVKIDILGNRSLAVLRDCIELANAVRAPEEALAWDFPGAPEDAAARVLVEAGKSMGVFYIESPATRQLLLKMGTVDYRRLVVASSIIRPAANKYISEYVRRLHGGSWRRFPAAVEKTLEETLGI
ncbi:MAG TPA: PHP domain-containing protein, partial [Rectinemataceae bacterium]|nr:PHP domain-containing protein [Rectinemataceae bacterium]